MDKGEWTLLVAGLSLAVVGAYIMARPRRLFVFDEDPAEYRPEAVEFGSDQARWLRRAAPAYLAVGLVLIAVAVL